MGTDIHIQLEAERASEETRRRREDMEFRDRELSDLRDRERRDRFRGRGEFRGGRRGGRDFDSRRGGGFGGWRRYRSPPPARSRGYGDTRGSFGGGDRYIPQGRRGGASYHGPRRPRSRSRSASYSSRSGSRSASPQRPR